MATDQQKARELFLHAVGKLPPEQWEGYVAEASAGDAELAKQVGRLLEVHREAGSFLDRPAAAVGATGVFTPEPGAEVAAFSLHEGAGTVIGPYKLLQQIGEGGMGTVFMAEQTQPVQRKVALKLIKPGMDTRQVIARFEAERQALAMMDHVNIARVFDAGATESGLPYFVMELVHGVPITKYCDDNHLTPRERLELFVPVCQAIQHAHQKGIIHRDIKPSNVMITLYDGKPVPKVIDFGVAKATEQKLTERTLFTQYGTMVGTLEYMSPEQAEMSALGVDTRSDIFSLGVLLYELLTGSTPLSHNRLKEAAYAEILRMIREEEPPRPSTRLSDSGEALASISAQRHMEPAKLTKLVRGELDWIVMKTLEKDRNRRYESASAFAADIQRYLCDEQVLACPPSAAYRLRKFVRRNKAPVVTALLIVLSLIGGIVGLTWGLVLAEQARDRETQRAEGERQATLEALAEKSKALAAVAAEKKATETALAREAETKAVLDFVQDRIFAAARPEGQEGGLGHDVQLRKAIQFALPFVEKSFTKEPLIEARLRMTLGSSFGYLGEAKIAAKQQEIARTIYTKQLGPKHPDTLQSMDDLAVSYAALGRHIDAFMLREETLALRKVTLTPDHADTLSSMSGLALSFAALGRPAEALKLHEETLALRRAKLGFDHRSTLRSMDNLANTFTDLGRHADALKLHEETLVLMKAKHGPYHPDTLASMNHMANSNHDLGRHADALKLHEEILAHIKPKLGPYHPFTFTSMTNVANSYSYLGRHADALKLREETLALQQEKLGPDHPDTLGSMNNLASSYGDLGRKADALKLFEETLTLMKAKLGPDHPRTLLSMNNLAVSYYALRRHADALKLYQETLALQKAKLGPDHPDTLTSMYNLALSYHALGRQTDALKLHEETLTLRKTNLGLEHPATLRSMNDVANSYAAVGRHAEALKLREETVTLRKARFGLDHAETLGSMCNLANSYASLGRRAEAVKLYEETLALMKAKIPDHQYTLNCMGNLAHNYTALDRHAEALKLHEETLALLTAKLGPDHPTTVASMSRLAKHLIYCPDQKLWAPAQVLQLARKTVALDAKSPQNRHVLGAALYRNGNWQEAIVVLEESVKLTGRGDAFNGLYLAMAHWKLNQKEKARAYLNHSEKWMALATDYLKKGNLEGDLRRLHTEALALIKSDDQSDVK